MLHFCMKLYFANICTSLSLFGFATPLLNLSVFFQIFEVFMLHVFLCKTAFCKYIHNVTDLAVFGFVTVIFL
jgi:hypothetical protein